ncbi:glutamic acid-rich protein-like [Thunnus maccoyii]|uniref:glutamic acid-rich protein-like n=1 Tax=Thunnus maccoyii TaxID=8240 RepID=UPI001C4C79C9|nr:glutamic acid-rich protein-like [Thunnus maccoyii]
MEEKAESKDSAPKKDLLAKLKMWFLQHQKEQVSKAISRTYKKEAAADVGGDNPEMEMRQWRQQAKRRKLLQKEQKIDERIRKKMEKEERERQRRQKEKRGQECDAEEQNRESEEHKGEEVVEVRGSEESDEEEVVEYRDSEESDEEVVEYRGSEESDEEEVEERDSEESDEEEEVDNKDDEGEEEGAESKDSVPKKGVLAKLKMWFLQHQKEQVSKAISRTYKKEAAADVGGDNPEMEMRQWRQQAKRRKLLQKEQKIDERIRKKMEKKRKKKNEEEGDKREPGLFFKAVTAFASGYGDLNMVVL